MRPGTEVFRVALDTPLRRLFDYLPPAYPGALQLPAPGSRVRVPFGRQRLVGGTQRHPQGRHRRRAGAGCDALGRGRQIDERRAQLFVGDFDEGFGEAKRLRIPRSEIDERKRSDVSLMPNGLAEGLSRQDFADLIAYLEGDFAAWCERHHAEQSRNTDSASVGTGAYVPDVRDEETELVIRRGVEHEAAGAQQEATGAPQPQDCWPQP